MAKITIGDFTGTTQIDVSDSSLAADNRLTKMTTAVSDFFGALSKPVTDPTFQDASFAATFENPNITVGNNGVDVKASVNSTLSVSRSADTPLFGPDDYDPIDIQGNDCWVSFEIDTLLDASVAVPLPDGFGVSFEASTAPQFATYVLFPGAQATKTLLSDALGQTIGSFAILDSPEAVLGAKEGFIYTNDLSGSVTVGGSWALPLAVNQLSLADAKLPFNASVSVVPSLTVAVQGDISLTSEFKIRMRRQAPNALYLGLYRKKSATLDASLSLSAGVAAIKGSTDLISAFFTAVSPKIDTSSLSPDDAAKIQQVLSDSIDRSLAISINAACSAAKTDEAAIAYSIDVSVPDQATKDAIGAALAGNWTQVSQLPNAKKLRNVITDTVEKTASLNVNLLGLYNYSSLADFVRTMKVVKNDVDGSITITDSATATRIATASTPLAAADDRLRAALYEGFLATATYQALLTGTGASPVFSSTQDLVIYNDTLAYQQAKKLLNAGEVLGVMPAAVKTKLPSNGNQVHHARFAASRTYTNDDVLHFFFSDITALTPRVDLKGIGRKVLAGLLDPQDPTDQKRIGALLSDQSWADMDANPATILEPFRTDWIDITDWADSLAKTAPLLAETIRYSRTVAGDPTLDAGFMKRRAALALALDGVTHNTHAAFDKAFAICVMSTLAGSSAGSEVPVFEAAWDSTTIFSDKPLAAAHAVR